MSTGSETTTRLSAAEKVRAVVWLATRPRVLEAETMAAAAKRISEELDIKLTAAVLQDILDADASLASKVAIGGSGALAHLTAVVEALSIRVDALSKSLDDFDLRLKSAVAHQDAIDQQVAGTLNALGRDVAAVKHLGQSLFAWAEACPIEMNGLQDAIMKRPRNASSEAKGEDSEEIPPVKDRPANGPGSVIPS